jgi:O-antigen ligase
MALFSHVDDDPSISGRTDDYAVVGRYIDQRPWLGRGLGSFVPSSVRPILDNQWLGSLIETGLIGVLALAGLFVVAFSLAKRTGRWAVRREDRSLGHALSAGVFSAALTSGTFDSLGFQGFGAVTFVLLGASARLWQLAGSPSPPMGPPSPSPVSHRPLAILRVGLFDWRRKSQESARPQPEPLPPVTPGIGAPPHPPVGARHPAKGSGATPGRERLPDSGLLVPWSDPGGIDSVSDGEHKGRA